MRYTLSVYVEDPLFDNGQTAICINDVDTYIGVRMVPFEGEVSLPSLQMMMANAGSLDDAAAMINKQLTPS